MKLNCNLTETVEQLGRVKAELSTLKAREESLKALLIDAAAHDVRNAVVEGPMFRSTVSFTDRKVTNWQGALEQIVEDYGIDARAIAVRLAEFTNVVEGLPCVRVTARKAA